MNWLYVILIAAVIFGIIGFLSAKDGERGEAAASGAAMGALGCGAIIIRAALGLLSIFLLIRLVAWLFS